MDRNEVSVAFEIVLEEIETVVDGLNEDGAGAFQKGDYDAARDLIETATRLSEFRGKVRILQKEWENLFSAQIPRISDTRRTFAKLGRWIRTPENAFRRPILEALIEMGSSGAVSEVLDRVGEKMKDILNEYDHQPLPSPPHGVRWRNTAQWCRNMMVHQEGLMKTDSPTGIWEISSQGKDALARGEIS